MNFREWLYPLFLAVSVTFFVQYFIGTQVSDKQQSAISGQSFVAPELKQAQKPLNLDVEFIQQDEQQEELHSVTTNLATYTFSSKGAVLTSLNFAWQQGKTNVEMLSNSTSCFLTGLENKAPLFYNFVKEYRVGEKAIAVEYQAPYEQGVIKKTFVVYQDTYQVDVKIAFEGKVSGQEVRLFFPMIQGIDGSSDEVKTFKNKASQQGVAKLQDINLAKQSKEFVFDPKVLGFSNKFLVQAFIKSEKNSVLRAFFKPLSDKQFDAVLESKALSSGNFLSWSFYFGPKTQEALVAVSEPLTQTLDYGWFTFIAKPMLVLLEKLEERTGSYGWAIILLTILLKLIMLPFSWKSRDSLKKQKEFEKKMAYITQKYKHDKQALDQAKAELIMKHGMPGLSAMIPGFINFPFFIALNRVLSTSIELHGASFLWMPDLSTTDPYYILGILTGICMAFVLETMSIPGRLGMGLMIGTVSMYLSSGLALFIFISTLLGVLQQRVMQSKLFAR